MRGHRFGVPAPASEPPAGADLEALATRLEARRDVYVAAGGRPSWTRARREAAVIIAAEALHEAPEAGAFDVRDRAMAANVAWLLEQQPAGTRMVLWAHNAHVCVHDPYAVVHPLGELLRRRYGADYLAIGAVFDQGSFLAVDGSRRRTSLAPRTLGPAPPGDLGATLARAGLPYFLLDLRPAAGDPASGETRDAAVTDWLARRHPMRETGSIFTGEAAMTLQMSLSDRFDAVLFVDRVSSARLLAAASR